MSISALRSRKGKELTKQMLIDKLDEVASLATAMETVLVEWETWWRIIPTIEKGMTAEEFAFYVKDGPIFNEFSQRIMQSIREHMPSIESVEEEVNKKPILDSNGNVANTPTDKKVLLDSKGNPIV